jgi:hypothetical protein
MDLIKLSIRVRIILKYPHRWINIILMEVLELQVRLSLIRVHPNKIRQVNINLFVIENTLGIDMKMNINS